MNVCFIQSEILYAVLTVTSGNCNRV